MENQKSDKGKFTKQFRVRESITYGEGINTPTTPDINTFLNNCLKVIKVVNIEYSK